MKAPPPAAPVLDIKQQIRLTVHLQERLKRAAELLTAQRGTKVHWSDVVREGAVQRCADLLGPDGG